MQELKKLKCFALKMFLKLYDEPTKIKISDQPVITITWKVTDIISKYIAYNNQRMLKHTLNFIENIFSVKQNAIEILLIKL